MQKSDLLINPDYVKSIPVVSDKRNLVEMPELVLVSILNVHNDNASNNKKGEGILKEVKLFWKETFMHFIMITPILARILNSNLYRSLSN